MRSIGRLTDVARNRATAPNRPQTDSERLAEISELADRILASNIDAVIKAETVEPFSVDTKLAGQTLAWMVMKGRMEMISSEPTQDDPDPKKIFRLK